MLYDQTLKALQRALALHDPAALPLTTGGDGGATADTTTPALLTALTTLRSPGTPAQLPLDGTELRDDELSQDLQIAYRALKTLPPADAETVLTLPCGAYGGLWLTAARRIKKMADAATHFSSSQLLRALFGWQRVADLALQSHQPAAPPPENQTDSPTVPKLNVSSMRLRWGDPDTSLLADAETAGLEILPLLQQQLPCADATSDFVAIAAIGQRRAP